MAYLAEGVLLLHAASTLFMVGVIWFVQVVHYPLFAGVGREGFAAYSESHSRRTGHVVGPPMLFEAATSVVLLFLRPAGVPASLAWAGAVLLAAVWLSTALLQVPRHRDFALGFRADAHRTLVLTNWIRTILWSARALITLAMVALAIEPTG